MSSEAAANILAVLVVYGSPPASSATLRSLSVALSKADAVLDLLVYDNSPAPMYGDLGNINGRFRVSCRHDPSNGGISAAVNAGANLAREQGKLWLLLLDQDTTFPPDAMTVYLAAISHGGGAMFVPRLVAGTKFLSPCGYRAGVGYHLPCVPPGAMSLRGRSVLNSGLLVELAAFAACGGYDERVRVDFADFAFINRFRRHYQEVVVLDLVCRHGYSNLETVDLEASLRRFVGYCRDGRAAATSPLLLLTHAFLVLRRCIVLTLRYGTPRFLARLPAYFFPERRTL